jgi:hypothetical protein
MNKTIKYFYGKKTYIAAGLTLIWAVIGGIMGWIEWEVASQLISGALLAAGLRNAI